MLARVSTEFFVLYIYKSKDKIINYRVKLYINTMHLCINTIAEKVGGSFSSEEFSLLVVAPLCVFSLGFS